MTDWRETTLGQFVSLQRGHDLPSEHRRAGSVPVMGSFGITGWHDEARAPGPGVTVGRSGASVGVVSYIDCDYWPLNTCLFATNFHGNHPRFVYYFLQTLDLAAHNSGSAQPSLNRNYISPIKIFVPDPKMQSDIVNLIGSLDDKIELNRRMNETLEAMAQAIFRDWFVDFGPTRRKLEGATDPLTIMGGLVQDAERAQALADLFPAALGDDGLPEGWIYRPFGSLLSDTIGGDWGKDTCEGENVHPVAIIRGTDFPDLEAGGVGKAPTRYTTVKKAVRRKLLPSDILIEVSGGSPTQPTGRSIFITQSVLDRFNSDVVCASFCRRFRAISHDSAVLAFEHLRNLYAEGGTWEYQNQSTGISNFQTTHFLEAEKVVFPGEELMEHFASLSGPMIEARYRNESMTLAATRDLLLPKLMSGAIRLFEAEDLMEAAQ